MRILMLNQAFYPDVVATGQYAADLAAYLAACGHEVEVIAARRGYDNPRLRFAPREVWRGVRIRRAPVLGLGKASRWRRALDFAGFLVGASLYLALSRRADAVIALTSPPLIAFLAALWVRWRGGRLFYWVMDLNPDEALAAGWLRAGSWTARLLDRCSRFSLMHAHTVIALDRFMQSRLIAKGVPAAKIRVLPPWPLDDHVRFDATARREFRAQWGLDGKFVVMYSGNHSPCHPLDTLLEAARRLASHPGIAFCFVGGGSEHQKVRCFAEQHQLNNILCLPYQPLERLRGSLSAADLHVVVMGDPFLGIVHPCKIYNILALGAPVLYIGPEESHVSDLMKTLPAPPAFYPARHGEASRVAAHILAASQAPPAERFSRLDARHSRDTLLPWLASCVEEAKTAACGAPGEHQR